MKKLLATFLCLVLMVTSFSVPVLGETTTNTVDNFIVNLYEDTLDRKPSASQITLWSNRLKTGQETASGLAYRLFFSKDYLAKNKSNEDFVNDLYMTLINRPASPSIKNSWSQKINSGTTRRDVFCQLTASATFTAFCTSAGIVQGYVRVRDYSPAEVFVELIYSALFGRMPALGIVDLYGKKLTNQNLTGANLVRIFIESSDYTSQNTSNTRFVGDLYKMINKKGTTSASQKWLTQLKNGKTRLYVVNGFTTSSSFKKLCGQYGVSTGKIDVKQPVMPYITGINGQSVANVCVSLLGVPYRYAGESRNGMDCSGLVVYAYREVTGYTLPHYTNDLLKVGRPVNGQWQIGDIILFNSDWDRSTSEHTGIYVGNGEFIHASSGIGKGRVIRSNVASYCSPSNIIAVRRVIFSGKVYI